MNNVTGSIRNINESFRTNTRIVFHRADAAFKPFNTISREQRSEFCTKTEEVFNCIGDFIEQNKSLIIDDITEGSELLGRKIERMKSKSSGFFAFLIFFFNSTSYSNLKRNIILLEQLKEKFDTVIRTNGQPVQPEVSDDDDLGEDNDLEDTNDLFAEPPLEGESPAKLGTPIRGTPQKPRTPHPKATTPHPLNTPLTRTPRGPLPHTPAPIPAPPPAPPPPPPPPPPMPLGRSTSRLLAPPLDLLPGEPIPPNIRSTKDVEDKEPDVQKQIQILRDQIPLIESHIAAFEAWKDPFKKDIDEAKALKIQLDDHQPRINLLNRYLEQCEKSLNVLETGERENTVVYLYYKTAKGMIKFPFFPDDMFDTIRSTFKRIVDDNPRSPSVPLDKPEPATDAEEVNDATSPVEPEAADSPKADSDVQEDAAALQTEKPPEESTEHVDWDSTLPEDSESDDTEEENRKRVHKIRREFATGSIAYTGIISEVQEIRTSNRQWQTRAGQNKQQLNSAVNQAISRNAIKMPVSNPEHSFQESNFVPFFKISTQLDNYRSIIKALREELDAKKEAITQLEDALKALNGKIYLSKYKLSEMEALIETRVRKIDALIRQKRSQEALIKQKEEQVSQPVQEKTVSAAEIDERLIKYPPLRDLNLPHHVLVTLNPYKSGYIQAEDDGFEFEESILHKIYATKDEETDAASPVA